MKVRQRIFAQPRVFAALFYAVACLPAPPAASTSSGSTGDVQTSVPLSDADPNVQTTTGGVTSGSQPFSAAQGSMTLSAASAPDLCLTVAAPTATSSALVLRTCDASVAQRFVLVSGMLQSSNGNCVIMKSGLTSTTGEVALVACDANNPNQKVVPDGGNLGIATPAGDLMLQSDRMPATTQSYISFAVLNPSGNQERWVLGQVSHDNQQSLITNGTHIVLIDDTKTCLTAQITNLSYETCAPANPNQAFIFLSDGTLKVGKTCAALRTSGSFLFPDCNPAAAEQHFGISNGIIFNGNGLCLDRNAQQPNLVTGKACDFTTSAHFVIGLSQ